jgi:hypothetical protein
MSQLTPVIVGGRVVIDPDTLLGFLQYRATILAERTAEPNLDPVRTELLRGQRVALLALIKDITETIDGFSS